MAISFCRVSRFSPRAEVSHDAGFLWFAFAQRFDFAQVFLLCAAGQQMPRRDGFAVRAELGMPQQDAGFFVQPVLDDMLYPAGVFRDVRGMHSQDIAQQAFRQGGAGGRRPARWRNRVRQPRASGWRV